MCSPNQLHCNSAGCACVCACMCLGVHVCMCVLCVYVFPYRLGMFTHPINNVRILIPIWRGGGSSRLQLHASAAPVLCTDILGASCIGHWNSYTERGCCSRPCCIFCCSCGCTKTHSPSSTFSSCFYCCCCCCCCFCCCWHHSRCRLMQYSCCSLCRGLSSCWRVTAGGLPVNQA